MNNLSVFGARAATAGASIALEEWCFQVVLLMVGIWGGGTWAE
eukprot:CAMPEP_0206260910 /NCGR_PEP_ID=MMETSP0047_2-20121206/27354_1 /ASSEMBLY_ACC=CAM_ASM_000192 /TAXON_ID=195065 /ORGANISM="Chroomonas mesostigmatica_cf, Strain CCMP1168" /LENGTH=42 /DNA_ID= /DNA_START= /DNA_END= /DNA_ORIENTATION=